MMDDIVTAYIVSAGYGRGKRSDIRAVKDLSVILHGSDIDYSVYPVDFYVNEYDHISKLPTGAHPGRL